MKTPASLWPIKLFSSGVFVKVYLIALGAGLLVGLIYSLLQVRSPAPPAIALIGLLGMLMGEQIIPVAKHWMKGGGITVGWVQHECLPKITGVVPQSPDVAAGGDSHENT